MEKNTQHYDESEEMLNEFYNSMINGLKEERKAIVFEIAEKFYKEKFSIDQMVEVLKNLPAEYANDIIMVYSREFAKSSGGDESTLYDMLENIYAKDFMRLVDAGKETKQLTNTKDGQRLLTKYELVILEEKFGMGIGDFFKPDLVINNKYGKRVYELLQPLKRATASNKGHALIEKTILDKLQESLQKTNEIISLKTEL